MNTSVSIQDRRKLIYDDLEQIRRLRNRIAHHKPIFTRNLSDDYQKILFNGEIRKKSDSFCF